MYARFFAFLAALLLSVRGAPPTRAEGAPAPTSQIVVAVQQEPATLNPVTGTLEVESDVFNLVFDGLFRSDASGKLVPDLAVRVPTQQNGDISRDGRTITYHLVKNAHWHDGPAVTSKDVKFTWEAIMNPNNTVTNRTGYVEFARVDTPDDFTVVVHLKRPWSPVVANTFADTIQGAIVPEHLLRGRSDLNREAFNSNPIGSGPYRFTAWHRGSDMVFESNPAYFRGAPHISRIVWHFIPDENAISNGLRAGEIDLTDALGPVAYGQLGHVGGVSAALGPSMVWEHLTLNTGGGPLADFRVRQALCAATDVSELFAKIVHGIGNLGAGLQNPQSPWYLKDQSSCRFDLAAAGKLLDSAGWVMRPDGTRAKDGKPLQLTFGTVAGMVDRSRTQVLLQSRWKELGVDTVLRTYPPSLFFAPKPDGGILYGGKFDVALSAFFIRSLDPSRIEFLAADQIPPAGNNAAYWRSQRVTALENAGATTYDPAARKKIYDDVQRIVGHDVPYVTIRWWGLIAMHRDTLHGVQPPLVGSIYWNVNDWTEER